MSSASFIYRPPLTTAPDAAAAERLPVATPRPRPRPACDPSLSADVFAVVASFLPLSFVVRLRLVSRAWRALSLHPAVYALQPRWFDVTSLESAELIRLAAVHPHLRHLRLSAAAAQRTCITAPALSFLFALLPSLASLSLSGCAGLTALPLPASLSRLSLTSTGLPAAALSSLSLLSTLTSLTLTDNAGLTDGCLLLLSSLPRLTALDVSQCPALSDEGVAALLGLSAESTAGLSRDHRNPPHHHRHQVFAAVRAFLAGTGDAAAAAAASTRCFSAERPMPSHVPAAPMADHVSAMMAEVGGLGEHAGLAMLSRAMSVPSFARHTAPRWEAEAEEETESASPSPSSPRSPASPRSPPSPPPPPFAPSPLCLSLRHLSLAHDRALSDACCAYLAYAALSLSSASSWSCYLSPADGTLMPLSSLDLGFLPLLTDFAAACLSLLSHLQALTLSQHPLLSDDALHRLATLPYLSSLALCGLPGLTHSSLWSLSSLLSLSELRLSSLPHVTDHSLVLLASLPLLQSLQLELLPLVSDRALIALSASTALTSLSLSHLGISRRGFHALHSCRALRTIIVRGCKEVGEEECRALQLCRPDIDVG